MTAPATSNPLRPKALGYLRDGRVHVHHAASTGRVATRTPGVQYVQAVIYPAAPAAGASVLVRVWHTDDVWECDEHPGENSCAHRLAVQMVTGYGHLGGAWKA